MTSRVIWLTAVAIASTAPVTASEPEHLEPISLADVRNADGRLAIALDQLVGSKSAHWMLVLPSFDAEYAVILRTQPKESAPEGFDTYIELARATTPVIGWTEQTDGRSAMVVNRHVEVSRAAKPMTRDDVDLLANATFEVILGSRYPNGPTGGLDGARFYFCFDRWSGEIGNPSTGNPAHLAKAWLALADYVRAATHEEEGAALAVFRTDCRAIPLKRLANPPSGEPTRQP